MFIYNTTFHVSSGDKDEFISWLKAVYVPEAVSAKVLRNPRLSLIMAHAENDDGISYSLQFEVDTIDALEKWYKEEGTKLLAKFGEKFQQRVLGFSTIMHCIDL